MHIQDKGCQASWKGHRDAVAVRLPWPKRGNPLQWLARNWSSSTAGSGDMQVCPDPALSRVMGRDAKLVGLG